MLYNKYIGETEKNLRRALAAGRIDDARAYCGWMKSKRVWAGGSSDEGTSQRLLGSLLTWMAEHSGNVFLVATANAIDTACLPSYLRKGRFDEIFFIDLPDANTLVQKYFAIHLQCRNFDPATF